MKNAIMAGIIGLFVGLVITMLPLQEPSPPSRSKDTGSWGPLTVDKVLRIAQLRVLQVESSKLVWEYRKQSRPYTRDTLHKWRNIAVVVPIRSELGIPIEQIMVNEEGERWRITLPEASILRTNVIYDRNKMLLWKDEGNAYKEEDLLTKAIDRGEKELVEKCIQQRMPERATASCKAIIRTIAEAAGVPPQNLIIEVRKTTTQPELQSGT